MLPPPPCKTKPSRASDTCNRRTRTLPFPSNRHHHHHHQNPNPRIRTLQTLVMDSLTRGSLIQTTKIPSSSPSFRPSKKPFSTPQNLSFSLPTNQNPSSTRVSASLKSAASVAVLTAALLAGKFSATAAPPPPPPPPAAATTESKTHDNTTTTITQISNLSDVLSSNADAINSLRALLYQKLESNEDSDALKILERLVAIQPSNAEWKFLEARLLNEMGRLSDARRVYADILAADPLCFEALFESSVLMDRCGEGELAVRELERALEAAKEGKREKEAREVRLVMAQVKYLQRDVEGALEMYRELAREDAGDYRPWFCQGVIYSLLDRNEEAREVFQRCKEICPAKFEVEGFAQTPLSRVKLFGVSGGGDDRN